MKKTTNLFSIVKSVIASFIGVQGNKKYDEDNDYLEKKGFTPFLIVGIFIVIIFLFSLTFIVNIILN